MSTAKLGRLTRVLLSYDVLHSTTLFMRRCPSSKATAYTVGTIINYCGCFIIPVNFVVGGNVMIYSHCLCLCLCISKSRTWILTKVGVLLDVVTRWEWAAAAHGIGSQSHKIFDQKFNRAEWTWVGSIHWSSWAGLVTNFFCFFLSTGNCIIE